MKWFFLSYSQVKLSFHRTNECITKQKFQKSPIVNKSCENWKRLSKKKANNNSLKLYVWKVFFSVAKKATFFIYFLCTWRNKKLTTHQFNLRRWNVLIYDFFPKEIHITLDKASLKHEKMPSSDMNLLTLNCNRKALNMTILLSQLKMRQK